MILKLKEISQNEFQVIIPMTFPKICFFSLSHLPNNSTFFKN